MILRYALLLTLVLRLGAVSLAERIDEAISASPAARSAFWGIQVVDLRSGKVLYQRNPNRFFVPASNTKLFTTALALTRLGPEFTYRTSVTAEKAPDANGGIHGDLTLAGGGDPNLSSRPIPYRTGSTEGDPLAAIEDLAAQVAARGVTRIDGDIVGDDRWYTWDPYAGGWSVDDPLYEYGTAVSAISVNDNSQSLQVLPGYRVGDLAGIELFPALEYYRIDNRVVTVGADGERRIHYDRMPGSLDLRVWGTVPLGKPRPPVLLGIDDPAAFAASALRDALERRGITVTGSAVAHHRFPNEDAVPATPGVELASHVSAPLLEDLRITDKVSQNLHAEMTLRAVGKAKRNEGTREAGLQELKAFLTEAGVAEDAWRIGDGSGLSRSNLVTPDTVVKLLRYMYNSPQRDNWMGLLPVGGQDGTLQNRSLTAAVHAKTGSVAHVSALSGYIERRGGWVAFSILVNNFASPSAEITKIMDRISAFIME